MRASCVLCWRRSSGRCHCRCGSRKIRRKETNKNNSRVLQMTPSGRIESSVEGRLFINAGDERREEKERQKRKRGTWDKQEKRARKNRLPLVAGRRHRPTANERRRQRLWRPPCRMEGAPHRAPTSSASSFQFSLVAGGLVPESARPSERPQKRPRNGLLGPHHAAENHSQCRSVLFCCVCVCFYPVVGPSGLCVCV